MFLRLKCHTSRYRPLPEKNVVICQMIQLWSFDIWDIWSALFRICSIIFSSVWSSGQRSGGWDGSAYAAAVSRTRSPLILSNFNSNLPKIYTNWMKKVHPLFWMRAMSDSKVWRQIWLVKYSWLVHCLARGTTSLKNSNEAGWAKMLQNIKF